MRPTLVGRSAVFVLIGSLTEPLLRAKDWLARENATVMFVVLLVLGVTIAGKGLAVVAG
jgi:hypothetical protein